MVTGCTQDAIEVHIETFLRSDIEELKIFNARRPQEADGILVRLTLKSYVVISSFNYLIINKGSYSVDLVHANVICAA